MKKILCALLVIFTIPAFLSGCAKNTDYASYISEKRTDIYMYSDDSVSIKIYVSEKENPYNSDGIKGAMTSLTEIFVALPENREEVNVSVGNANGEMNYRAVENIYYLSLSNGGVSGDSAAVTLTYGEESNSYTLLNVRDDSVMDCESAVKCVTEHNPDLFASLTENKIFKGEIYVRLLYDEGCYYYVGVCDREKNIDAYLVDGVRGKIIANKKLNG